MSISLPSNKYEKLARYNLLARQGIITIQQAKREYRRYLFVAKVIKTKN